MRASEGAWSAVLRCAALATSAEIYPLRGACARESAQGGLYVLQQLLGFVAKRGDLPARQKPFDGLTPPFVDYY